MNFGFLRSIIQNVGIMCLHIADHIPTSNINCRKLFITKRIIKKEDQYVLVKRDGLFWKLDPLQYIDRTIITEGVFEKDSILWVKEIVRPGMIVIDIGANFGYYTIIMSKLVGETGRVYSFEPSKFFRDRLEEHVMLNSCANCSILDYGLSDKNVVMQLYKFGDSACVNWYDERKEPEGVETVALKRFDDFVEENPISQIDFIKIDIDGHEPNFLKGAYKTILKYRPIIQIEFQELALLQNNSDVEELALEFQKMGYELYSEHSKKKINTRTDLIIETKNCAYSVNVFCFPVGML